MRIIYLINKDKIWLQGHIQKQSRIKTEELILQWFKVYASKKVQHCLKMQRSITMQYVNALVET